MEEREKVILVTGSTGFLGSAVTRRLLVSGCKLRLLIRNRNNKASSNSFKQESTIQELILGDQCNEHLSGQHGITEYPADKDGILYDLFLKNVEIVEGDITSENLGLEKNEYIKLCHDVDEIIHCAAQTHFEDQRAKDLMFVNVMGTENMLRFAGSGKQKRFHHISTAYVAGKQSGIIYEEELVNEPQFNNEYERSKFIAEQVVITYAKNNKIPYTIYRPSIIVGDSLTGVTCRFDNLYIFAKVLFRIGNGFAKHNSKSLHDIIVRVPGVAGALVNLVPIDYVADAITEIVNKKETVNNIFHITNPNPPKLGLLRDMLLSVMKFERITVSIDGQMERKHLSSIEKLFLRQTKTYYSYLFSKLRFDCRNTQSILGHAGITCPAMTVDLIRILVDYAISRNWGERKRTVLQEVTMV